MAGAGALAESQAARMDHSWAVTCLRMTANHRCQHGLAGHIGCSSSAQFRGALVRKLCKQLYPRGRTTRPERHLNWNQQEIPRILETNHYALLLLFTCSFFDGCFPLALLNTMHVMVSRKWKNRRGRMHLP